MTTASRRSDSAHQLSNGYARARFVRRLPNHLCHWPGLHRPADRRHVCVTPPEGHRRGRQPTHGGHRQSRTDPHRRAGSRHGRPERRLRGLSARYDATGAGRRVHHRGAHAASKAIMCPIWRLSRPQRVRSLRCCKKGDLVILESTSPVGTTEQMARWFGRLRPDLSFPVPARRTVDVNVAYCPERVLPGRVVHELVENDRIIGGMTPGVRRARRRALRHFRARASCW